MSTRTVPSVCSIHAKYDSVDGQETTMTGSHARPIGEKKVYQKVYDKKLSFISVFIKHSYQQSDKETQLLPCALHNLSLSQRESVSSTARPSVSS